jgi:hypothetical protein
MTAEAIALQKQMDAWDETSTDFASPLSWEHAQETHRRITDRLNDVEQRIDQTVSNLYQTASSATRPRVGGALDQIDLARRWVGYAVGVHLGRWGVHARGSEAAPVASDAASMLCLRQGERSCAEIFSTLERLLGERSARQIDEAVGGIGAFLTSGFSAWHNRLYGGRPVFWSFASDGRVCIVRQEAGDDVVRDALGFVGGAAPAGWSRWADDGVLLNLSPLRQWVQDSRLRESLETVAADAAAGRYAFAAGAHSGSAS